MVTGGAGGGDSGDGRSYAELKAELENIQAIIFDETGKYTEKEKEDANIRYEKVLFSSFLIFSLPLSPPFHSYFSPPIANCAGSRKKKRKRE